jgi:hypothetical protein
VKKLIAAAAAACALAVAPAAGAGTVTLFPTSFGAFTTAAWRAQLGLPDTVGSANQALVLEKDGFDPGPAATAVVNGVAGERVQTLTGLEWQRQIKTDCTKTSPRWTLTVQGKSGRTYLARFGCAQSAHAPGATPEWVRDFNSQTLIRTRVLQAGGSDALAGTIVSLAIVFDERGQTGTAVLDNIRVVIKSEVGANTWTCAADNAEVVPGSDGFAPDDLLANPLSQSELMTLDEIWPTLTPDDQALASSDQWVE